MKRMTVVYQTHWDREWYYNVDTYMIRMKHVLKRIMDLLDCEAIESFVFDGQVRALEDYLAIAEPKERQKILSYVEDGRIVIGPWYVLADEFLVDGESLIRNLEIGIDKATSFGGYQKVGYLPDSFGHVSQMPQILRGFQLEHAILWRGVVPDDLFFQWQAPNQDSVFAVYLKEGYYQPIIEQEQYKQLFASFLEKITAFSDAPHLLLTNGGDHLMPALADVPSRIVELSETHDLSIDIGTYEQYLNAIDKRSYNQTITGELRDNRGIYVLPNVLSSRYDLKRTNRISEMRLRTLEALAAKSHLFDDYPQQRLLDTMWETLLLNHPHDSICGCSIDDVHREMEVRSTKLNHQLDALIKQTFVDMDAYRLTHNYDTNDTRLFSDDSRFTVVNPTLRKVHGLQKVTVFLADGNPLNDGFVVSDGTIDYTTVIVAKRATRRFESPLDDAPRFLRGHEYDIVFRVKNLYGVDGNPYVLKAGQPITLATEDQPVIENAMIRVALCGNDLTITDKRTGQVYPHCNAYVSSLDAGDEYNYSQPANDTVTHAELVSATAYRSDTYQELRLRHRLSAPTSLNDDRSAAIEERMDSYLETVVSLYADRADIDVVVDVDNRSKDHRLRVHFDSPERVVAHFSDTAFDVVRRDVRDEAYDAPKQKEVPVVVDPSLSMIALDSGIRVDHEGMHEYQVRHVDDHSRLEITMLRAVGHLSRDDLRSRGGGAGPSFPTPDAQMIGQHAYRYKIHVGDVDPFANNDTFRQPLLITKGHLDKRGSLLQIANPHLHVSSLRKRENELELRVFNPGDDAQTLALQSSYPIETMRAVDFLGEPLDGSVSIIAPRTIRTFRLLLSEKPQETTDVLVVGGSIGGVQAAISLAQAGRDVLLVEESDWLGGQLTSQAVPLDEHPFIESFGCTKRYRAFRDKARDHYRNNHEIKAEYRDSQTFNPGNAWVTNLAFEPKVAKLLFDDMVAPYEGNNLEIRYRQKAIRARTGEDNIESVTLQDTDSLAETIITAKYFIDGTDLGDLLPLSGTEFVTGAESKDETNEFHAAATADPTDLQPVTHVVAMRWDDQATTTIDRPAYYEYFRHYKTPYSDQMVLSEYGPDSSTKRERKFNTYDGRMALWRYRRYFDPTLYEHCDKPERTTINWPQNDYFLGNIFDDEWDDHHRHMAKELTRSFVYYLQTEVPRHDGGHGYPEMQIATNELGTTDGFAMMPYIRESRRIRALKTVVEEDVSARANATLPHVDDSVGVGSYHIDLHITTKSHRFFFDNTWPFEIPLGALIPIRVKNLLPACKNIGTTHLTNGCFRLHPVEWNVGEVAGYLVDFLLRQKLTPQQLYQNKSQIKRFQEELRNNGVELSWPEDKVKVI